MFIFTDGDEVDMDPEFGIFLTMVRSSKLFDETPLVTYGVAFLVCGQMKAAEQCLPRVLFLMVDFISSLCIQSVEPYQVDLTLLARSDSKCPIRCGTFHCSECFCAK